MSIVLTYSGSVPWCNIFYTYSWQSCFIDYQFTFPIPFYNNWNSSLSIKLILLPSTYHLTRPHLRSRPEHQNLGYHQLHSYMRLSLRSHSLLYLQSPKSALFGILISPLPTLFISSWTQNVKIHTPVMVSVVWRPSLRGRYRRLSDFGGVNTGSTRRGNQYESGRLEQLRLCLCMVGKCAAQLTMNDWKGRLLSDIKVLSIIGHSYDL